MNKNILQNKIQFLTAVITLTIVFGGCEKTHINDDFYEINVPAEQTRQIETFQPEELLPSEPAPTEPNIVPPKELTLTLEQCRSMALENNLALQAQLIAPSIAEASLRAAEAKFEAAFTLNSRFYRTDQPGGSIDFLEATSTYITSIASSQRTNANLDLGVQVPLQTGGTVTFNMADSRSKSLERNSLLSPWYEENFQVSISQPLLQNAGHRANLHSIRLAKYNKQIQDNATKLEVIMVLAAADRAYWRLYAARRELQVRKQQHDLAIAQLERAKRFVEAGEMAQVEILRAEAGVARQLAAIITAENNLRDRQREFKRTINKPGMDIDTITSILPASEPDPVNYLFEHDRVVDLAIENRTQLLQLELQLAQDISNIDYARNQALPIVNLNYTYNINGVGPTRDDSWDMLNDKNYENHYLGLNLWVPLGNQLRKNQLRAAVLTRKQRLASKENVRQLIKQEVLNAIDQIEANWQQILASRQSAILDGRLYEAEMRQFEIGLRTSTDVLQAQTNFANSQSAEISALTQYQISLVDLAYATGTLLGAAKVEWEPLNP
jgi:outer membrane protein TolC